MNSASTHLRCRSFQITNIFPNLTVLENLRLMLQRDAVEVPRLRERELRLRQQRAELELFRETPERLHFFLAEIVRLVRRIEEGEQRGQWEVLPSHYDAGTRVLTAMPQSSR